MAALLSAKLDSLTSSSFPKRLRPLFAWKIKPSNVLTGNLTTSVSMIRAVPSFADLEITREFAKEMLDRTDNVFYTIADATASADTTTVAKHSNDLLFGVTNLLESTLKILKDGLSTLHVPYSYGFAIILLTFLIKVATFPFTKKQIESSITMRKLQPRAHAIQKLYSGNQEMIQHETARLYKLAGVNPFAGWLPTLATVPIWIGLYRALSNVTNEGLLTEGFFWIPSLSGPTAVAAQQGGSAISWLFPFKEGHPPLGWSDTCAYLVLPILLVIAQYVSIQITQPSQSCVTKSASSKILSSVLPLMVGYFALSVPSGLSLYWLTNNILSTSQQMWMNDLISEKDDVLMFSDESREELPSLVNSHIDQEPKVLCMDQKKSAAGPKQGERFRQIKAEEAMLKRQREEEKHREVEASKCQTVVRGSDVGMETDEADGKGFRASVGVNDRVFCYTCRS